MSNGAACPSAVMKAICAFPADSVGSSLPSITSLFLGGGKSVRTVQGEGPSWSWSRLGWHQAGRIRLLLRVHSLLQLQVSACLQPSTSWALSGAQRPKYCLIFMIENDLASVFCQSSSRRISSISSAYFEFFQSVRLERWSEGRANCLADLG